jgi:hypothetical protein
MSVGEIRARFHDHFDISPESRAMIGGNIVDDATIVQAGQYLTFLHYAGEKGVAPAGRAAG